VERGDLDERHGLSRHPEQQCVQRRGHLRGSMQPAAARRGLVFTLGAKPTVQRSGNHQLTVRWKVEAIGS
jgi:hypothetical protein